MNTSLKVIKVTPFVLWYSNTLFVLLSFMLLVPLCSLGQPTERIKLFINCQVAEKACFDNYLITELSFFKFVRDRAQADVEILLIEQSTASDGTKYSLQFNGMNTFASIQRSSTVVVKPAETEFLIREALLKSIKSNLLPFVFETDWKKQVVIEYPKDSTIVQDQAPEKDKWNNWVLMIGTEGNFSGESNRNQIESESYFSIFRITQRSKFVADSWYQTRFNSVSVDNTAPSARVNSYGSEMYYVHSFGEHLSLGVFFGAEHDNYRNIKIQTRVAPAIEYNFYKFSENATRQLRLGYQAGIRSFNYLDSTVFDKLHEIRSFHQVSLVANYTRPWGSLSGVLQGSAFLDNHQQNRLTARVNMAVRLAEGLNFTIEGSTALVNNQISLLKKEQPYLVYLLDGAMLATKFLYEVKIGFSFTFGSINNSVVNPRFENLNE